MKKRNSVILILIVLLISSLLGYFFIFNKKTEDPNLKSRIEHYNVVLKNIASARDYEVGLAIEFFSKLRDKERGLGNALTYLESGSLRLKLSCLRALKFFDDESSYKALSKYVDSKVDMLRYNAILSLGGHKEDIFYDLALSLYKKELYLDVISKVAVYSVILEDEKDEELQKLVLEQLLTLADDGDFIHAKNARVLLLNFMDKDKRVKDVIYQEIERGRDISFIQRGIYLLASKKDKWLKDNIEKFLHNKNSGIQFSSVGALHLLCLKNTGDIIYDAISKNKNETLNTNIIFSLKKFHKKSTLIYIKKLLVNKKLSEMGRRNIKYIRKIILKDDINFSECELTI